jgi:hypothetical protein
LKRLSIFVALALLAMPIAAFAQPRSIEGVWSPERRLCGIPPENIRNPARHPIEVTREAINWTVQQCTLLRRSGRNGTFRVSASCERADGTVDATFTLRLRGNRLTVIFADGKQERFVRCPG